MFDCSGFRFKYPSSSIRRTSSRARRLSNRREDRSASGAITGQVFNSTTGFAVAAGKPASFIFATEDGTIAGWNSTVDATHAVTKVDNSASGAVYQGLALATAG